jgi:hypothetical protein
LIDSQGKLFGRINIVDATVLLAVLAALFAFVFLRSDTSAQLSQERTPVEVDMLVRSLSIADPGIFEPGKETSVVIRNQPAGNLAIRRVKIQPHLVPLVINNRVTTIEDPDDPYGRDYVITLAGMADVTGDGLVIGRVKAKVGTPIEIEGYRYIVRGGIVDVRRTKAIAAQRTP